jgi:hypothetical protein
MDEANASPLVVPLLFLARCLVPLLLLLGISYLLKKLGFVKEPPAPPPEYREGEENNDPNHYNTGEGGLAHGKT